MCAKCQEWLKVLFTDYFTESFYDLGSKKNFTLLLDDKTEAKRGKVTVQGYTARM